MIDFEEEEWWLGGGDKEGVPNTWAGGSHPGTTNQRMLRAPALRRLHLNITNYVKEEMEHRGFLNKSNPLDAGGD